MKRLHINHLKIKLIVTVVLAAILFLYWLFKVPCIYQFFLGIPCPCCGMTRAVTSLIRLDIGAAFSFHPMFWSLPILYIYFLTDGKLFGKKALDIAFMSAIGVGFIINWVIRLMIR